MMSSENRCALFGIMLWPTEARVAHGAKLPLAGSSRYRQDRETKGNAPK
jgi:hypothetical protein